MFHFLPSLRRRCKQFYGKFFYEEKKPLKFKGVDYRQHLSSWLARRAAYLMERRSATAGTAGDNQHQLICFKGLEISPIAKPKGHDYL